ncbi:MAG: LPS assembly protein LptD [Desulfobacula sp.]|nr:LPS assembly protein LptD [Desulfobacula sp.]
MLSLSKAKKQSRLIFFAFIVVYLLINGTAVAKALDENPEKIPWHISAHTVTYDNKRSLYIAEDNVLITGGKTRLEADYVEFSNITKDAFAQGNVLFISGKDSIVCNAMNINLATEIGTINKGTIYIQENNFYIHGETIRKTGRFTYSADKGSITSCPGDSPDWKITGKKIKVTVNGYGQAYNTVLWAKNIPALYSPVLIFPVKAKRQTGLLVPSVTSSERKGFEYNQPLFIALSQSSDATLYADYMSDRGTKIGAEYRYILDNTSKGSMFIDFLQDDKIDDGTEQTELYSYEDTPQRTNRDRFWIRMKHDQELPDGFTAKLDMDIVSDEDYLKEFNDGFTGYTETKGYFDNIFGRSIDEYDDTTRKNWLNLRKNWSTYAFNVDAFWYDNITARRQNTDDTTLQTLPAIQFDSSRQKVFDTRLYYSLDSEFRTFYRKDTTATLVNGQRADIYPKFYLPVKLGKAFYFEPYIGLRQTVWHTSQFTDSNGNDDGFRTREMYDLGADLSTKAFKIYDPANDFAGKLKHEIIPKLEWDYTPYISQTEFPSFDGVDKIAEKNLMTWSVVQNLTARQTRVNSQGRKDTTYSEVAYILLFQSYDIKKERDNVSEPFSDLTFESDFYPHKYTTFYGDFTWSPYDYHFKTLAAGATIKDNRGDTLRTEYRYTTSVSESLYSRIDISLTDEIMVYYSFEKNLETTRTLETNAGLSLKRPCWSLNLFYAEIDAEKNITFLITLNGIGEFGTQ